MNQVKRDIKSKLAIKYNYDENTGNNTQKEEINLSNVAKLGDYISMTPSTESYTLYPIDAGYDQYQTIYPKELNLWRIIIIKHITMIHNLIL